MGTRLDNAFGILMYHRVTPRIDGVPRPTWNVPPDRFRRQLIGLLSRGYRPWPLRRVVACRMAGELIPARTFVVTFDDGYENVYENAWPVLKELSIPATVFVVTAYLDARRPFPFDDWAVAGSAGVPASAWRPLSTAHCGEMLEHGLVDIGSHTHTHADCRGRPESFRQDLVCSLHVLRDTLGVSGAALAFPFGRFGPEMVAVSREAGVSCALTAEPRLVAAQSDPFSWGRFHADGSDTAATLALKLNGWYSALRDVWRRFRRPCEAALAPLGRREHGPRPGDNCTPAQGERIPL
jgi:peptidoglycan/xylan/chitin deacetylase (PgdA/CDA1 family)